MKSCFIRFFLAISLGVLVAANAQAANANNPTSESGPESQLLRVFDEIEKNRLNKALQETEALLKRYPTFRLANLIRGDLLLARQGTLKKFGDANEATAATQEKIDDLKAEAIARLKAYRERKNLADRVPRYLLQMQTNQAYAIVIDAQKSRLYLYKNNAGDGKPGSLAKPPSFVADYYMSQGKLGSDKRREGDKKTPIGVYHVTASLQAEKLGDLYGTGAFPINYPNEWDKRQGRSGYGIWLHGVPTNTYSRPPKASDGCVALSNEDINALAKNLQIGLTPVIISDSVEWVSADDWQQERASLAQAINAWKTDWESRSVDQFLAHYGKNFYTKGQDLAQFAKQKRQVNASKEWIKLKLSNVSMFRNPSSSSQEKFVVVTFEQDYQSNNLSNQMKKRQYWFLEDGRWKIIYEGVA